MARYLLMIACSLLLMNCNGVGHTPQSATIKVLSHQDTLKLVHECELLWQHRYDVPPPVVDSVKGAFLKEIDEPAIEDISIEAYRFEMYFDRKCYLFRVQQDASGKTTLISKCFFIGKEHGLPGATITYKGRSFIGLKDTMLGMTSQNISERNWKNFKEILDGSYYWALDSDPFSYYRYHPFSQKIFCYYGAPPSLSLESHAFILNDPPMKYHYVHVRVTPKGSLVHACAALMKISNLTTKDAKKLLAGLE